MHNGTITHHHTAKRKYVEPTTLYLNHVKHELGALSRRNARLKRQLQGYKAMLEALEDALDRQGDDINTLLKNLKRPGATNGTARQKVANGRPVTP